MQSIVSRGKDVKEAIQLGLDLLNAGPSEVHIEIIQHESKGLFGIGGKHAVVKLSKANDLKASKAEDSFESIEQMIDDIDEDPEKSGPQAAPIQAPDSFDTNGKSSEGTAWVKHGRLYCRSSRDQYPTVAFNKDIQLLKNNTPIQTSPAIISEKDHYEIQPLTETKETSWKVTMDSSKIKVTLRVDPGYKRSREVLDTEPEAHIVLQTKERKEIQNTLTYEQIIGELQRLRVVQGFNQNEMMKATETKEPGTFEIATGTPAKEGKNGWLEPIVDVDPKHGLKEDENGKVDFRETRTIPTVENGKVIAVIHPPIPGQSGVTVTNEPLPAKQTVPVELKVGKGVMTVDDKVVAAKSGRPKIEQRGNYVKVSIMPKLIHRGDVDLASGNIHFNGDVEVYGDIKEGMSVEAEGDILTHSTVNFAALTSSGAIIAQEHVVSSELSAGKNNMLVAELGHLLGIMYQQVEKMSSFIKQLARSPAFKNTDISLNGLQPLIKILLEKKFKNFTSLAKKYVEVTKKGKGYLEQEEWTEAAHSIHQIFLSLSNEVISQEIIDDLSLKMKRLHEWSKTSVEPEAYITLSSALNCRLYSSGDITIIGQGCINTKVHAGGYLKVTGVVRGGELYGKSGIEINETGSESGTSTFLAVPNDQTIRINKAMEGTTIKIDNMKYVFRETTYNVNARLDQNDGQIVINE